MSEPTPPTAASAADDGQHAALPTKAPLAPNEGKSLSIEVDGTPWARVPVQTELFARDDVLVDKLMSFIVPAAGRIADPAERADVPALRDGLERTWYAVISEKVVAITQGRSYFTWEINPGTPAKLLARFVHRTPAGIGLGSPWTMQLAINEAGLPRIVTAAAASVVGKLLGRRGWFYRVVGNRVNAIDGPTPYSAYPSNVSAKLPPKDPDQVAAVVSQAIRDQLPAESTRAFAGTVVMDSNDLGRDILGQDTHRPDAFFTELFADNPFGQGRQQTPIALCVEAAEAEDSGASGNAS